MGERRTTDELGRASAGPSDVEAERAMMMNRREAVADAVAETRNELAWVQVKANMRGWDMGRVMKRSEGGMVPFTDEGTQVL